MKQLIVIFAFLTVCSVNAQWWGKTVKGNGKMTTVTRTTDDYEGIRCAGSMDFELVAGQEGKITIEAEENLMEHIVTEIKNGQLVVKVKKNVNLKPSWGKTFKVTIPFEDIDNVSLAGSGDLITKNTISADDFEISLAGSGDMNVAVNGQAVSSSIAGSGDIKLTGKTDYLKVKVAGSGDFNGSDLNANNTEVSIAGSGDALVVANQSIKARVAGSGDVVYKGNPDKEDTKVLGSGSIRNQ